ncbi:MAG: hypothetical protein Q8M37_13455 [Nevskia sp.]|nr:hypothetical protein [Nevskia sp.]
MNLPKLLRSPGTVGLLSLIAAASLAGCASSIRPQMNEIVITAIPDETAACRYVGFVAVDSVEGQKSLGMDQLRAQAVRLKANTVLVSSYSASRDGKAFVCDPPLKPR